MFEQIVNYDKSFANFLAANRDPDLFETFSWLTVLGDWWLVLIILLVVAFTLEHRHRNWRLAALVIGFVGTQATVFLMKYVVGRERPGVIEDAFVQNLSNTASFPSGHAATAMAFYGILLYLIITKEKNRSMQIGYFFSGAALILLIGFSRLYIGVHYLSDVIAGFLVGGIFLAISIAIARKRIPKSWKERLEQFSEKWNENAKNRKE